MSVCRAVGPDTLTKVMEFQLLGPFEARHEGVRVLVADRRQERCLLSVLLLEAGRVVATDRLADLLWDGDASASARRTIHTYIGRIRARLRPHGLHIDTRHGGYVLDPGGHTIDAGDFIALCGRARATADAVQRVRHYDKALALWRGPLLADVADDALRERLGSHLDELRMSALEQRAEAHLELGEHDKVVADLSPLAPGTPNGRGWSPHR